MTKGACVSGKSIRNYVDNRLLALCIIQHSKVLAVAWEVTLTLQYFTFVYKRDVGHCKVSLLSRQERVWAESNTFPWEGLESSSFLAALTKLLIATISFLVSVRLSAWKNPAVTDGFINLVVCLTTGPKSLPKRALHIVRSRAYSFKWEYPLLSLRTSNSFLRLLPCLPVISIPPCIFPSITRCRRKFLSKMWPIQFAFRLRISCRIFLYSLTLSSTSSFLTWSVQLIFSILLQLHIWKLSRCFWSTARSIQVSAPYKAMLQT